MESLVFGSVLLLVTLVVVSPMVRYDGYRVIRIVPEVVETLHFLETFHNQYEHKMDFWKTPMQLNHPTDVMIPPDMISSIESLLESNGIEFTVHIEDVQGHLDKQSLAGRHNINLRDTDHISSPQEGFDYNVYHTYNEIREWMRDIAVKYRDMVEEIVVGKSFEGYEIRLLKIGKRTEGKPAVYMQGGIHAREWIAPATTIYIVKQLLDNYGTDVDVTTMLDKFDWYILPVLNVDGYNFTWTNNRLWRKNRNINKRCIGVDLNRNYDYKWGGYIGASGKPCAETYHGDGPLSEPETKAVTDFLLKQKNLQPFHAYLDFHSYGQYWLYPWGYSKIAPNPQQESYIGIVSVANLATSALKKVYGTTYTVGASARTLYSTTGISADWGYAKLEAKYSYSVELRDTGFYGFLLPERLIYPTGIETFAAVKEMGKKLVEEYCNI